MGVSGTFNEATNSPNLNDRENRMATDYMFIGVGAVVWFFGIAMVSWHVYRKRRSLSDVSISPGGTQVSGAAVSPSHANRGTYDYARCPHFDVRLTSAVQDLTRICRRVRHGIAVAFNVAGTSGAG